MQGMKKRWKSERLFHAAEDFILALMDDIDQARHSIWVESYIFEKGRLTDDLLVRLYQALNRGVQVRILVDGLGSALWLNEANSEFRGPNELLQRGIDIGVFHPLPWPLGRRIQVKVGRWFRLWMGLNRRNHRKLYLIDGDIAYLGSINLSDSIFFWRESGVRVEGDGVRLLKLTFLRDWHRSYRRYSTRPDRTEWGKPLEPLLRQDMLECGVMVNQSLPLRLAIQATWLRKMNLAQNRIWIMSPYFVPTWRQFRSLVRAVKRGVDVVIIVPGPSDVPLVKIVGYYFTARLARLGAHIYEYQPRILHAKLMLIDDEVIIGSSNWNHRSWLWDFELDLVLTSRQSLQNLEQQFILDKTESQRLVVYEQSWVWFLKMVTVRLLLIFKRWM